MAIFNSYVKLPEGTIFDGEKPWYYTRDFPRFVAMPHHFLRSGQGGFLLGESWGFWSWFLGDLLLNMAIEFVNLAIKHMGVS